MTSVESLLEEQAVHNLNQKSTGSGFLDNQDLKFFSLEAPSNHQFRKALLGLHHDCKGLPLFKLGS